MESLKTTDDQSEASRQAMGSTAPRVTLDSMLAKIVDETFWVPEGTVLTICVLTMKNGFHLIGKSAPAAPENFNPELGKKFAKEDAVRQLWQLEGYLLREHLSLQP